MSLVDPTGLNDDSECPDGQICIDGGSGDGAGGDGGDGSDGGSGDDGSGGGSNPPDPCGNNNNAGSTCTVTVNGGDPDSCDMSDPTCQMQYQNILWQLQGQSIGAPNNWTLWYKNPCIQSALAKGAASSAIDAVGLLPEDGAVAGAFSLWHGAAGVSNGIKILQRAKFGAGIISTASAGSDASGDDTLSLAGAQFFTGFASIGAGLAKATPVVGQVLSGISVAEDLFGSYKAVVGCHP